VNIVMSLKLDVDLKQVCPGPVQEHGVKKYRGHRVLPKSIMKEFDNDPSNSH